MGFIRGGNGVFSVYDGESFTGGRLQGNGDFRSEECEAFLREADVVVTNPPFSLFREYVAQLMEFGKKFLIIGNMNAITYKEIFPLIKENKLWAGYSFNKSMDFEMPDSYEGEVGVNGRKVGKVPAICWFTNIPHDKRNRPLTLYKKYNPQEFPKYDNYDAIEVSKTADIPMDYDGVMGVPISFLDKYCPEQFEILNANDYRTSASVPVKPHGLVKDKDSYITERESGLRPNTHTEATRTWCQDQSLTERRHTDECSSNELLAPGADGWHVNGKRKYARVFIHNKNPNLT